MSHVGLPGLALRGMTAPRPIVHWNEEMRNANPRAPGFEPPQRAHAWGGTKTFTREASASSPRGRPGPLIGRGRQRAWSEAHGRGQRGARDQSRRRCREPECYPTSCVSTCTVAFCRMSSMRAGAGRGRCPDVRRRGSPKRQVDKHSTKHAQEPPTRDAWVPGVAAPGGLPRTNDEGAQAGADDAPKLPSLPPRSTVRYCRYLM